MKVHLLWALVALTSSLSAQTLDWASRSGSTTGDIGACINSDGNGNVYTSTNFSGTIDFDPGSGVANLTSAGLADGAIQKLDANGQLVWAKRLGSTGNDAFAEFCFDENNNFYVAGRFEGVVDVDFDTGVTNLTSSGSSDLMIMKYDANATLIWAKQIGSTLAESAAGISIDTSGSVDHILITGTFNGTVDFDPGSGTSNLTSSSGADIYVLKLDASGNFVWARSFAGTSAKEAKKSGVDHQGNVYTGGNFQGTIDLNPGTATFNVSSSGNFDFFLAKLDASGNFVWGHKTGGSSIDKLLDLETDSMGNVYPAGFFQGTVDLDPGTGTTSLSSLGQSDAVVQKFNSNGNLVWVKRMAGAGDDKVNNITLDVHGDVYTTGFFGSTCDFDPNSGVFNMVSSGSDDIFFHKMDSSGIFQWAYGMGSNQADKGNYISVASDGKVHITGYFQNTVDFDPGPGTVSLTSAGSFDIFSLQFSFCTETANALADSFCTSYVSPSGKYIWTTPGVYQDTLTNTGGCDSVLTITLSSPSTTGTISDSVCDSYLSPSGKYLWSSTGTYLDTIPNTAGCDSIITVNLTVDVSTFGSLAASSCDSFTSPSGNFVWTTSGSYTDVIPNSKGCDSVISILLTILDNTTSTFSETTCDSYTSPSGKYTWTTSGVYLDTLTNSLGCDSTMIINLTINSSSSRTLTESACKAYTSPSGKYTWTTSGVYNDTLTNASGCPDWLTINLTVTTIDTSVTQNGPSLTANASGMIYQWLDCNNGYAMVPSATFQTIEPPFNGTFAVAINNSGCIDTSACHSIANVGIDHARFATAVQVYPNPSSGSFHIDLGKSYPEVSIEVHDVQGKRVFTHYVNEAQRVEVDLTGKAKGIYTLTVLSGDKRGVYLLGVQ